MYMGMQAQLLTPSVQHTEETNFGAEVLGIARHFQNSDLNGVQVGAGFQQVGGEAVTENVGINFLVDPARRAAY